MSLSLTNIVVLICMIIYVCYLSLDICLQDEPVTDKHCGTYMYDHLCVLFVSRYMSTR